MAKTKASPPIKKNLKKGNDSHRRDHRLSNTGARSNTNRQHVGSHFEIQAPRMRSTKSEFEHESAVHVVFHRVRACAQTFVPNPGPPSILNAFEDLTGDTPLSHAAVAAGSLVPLLTLMVLLVDDNDSNNSSADGMGDDLSSIVKVRMKKTHQERNKW